MLLLEPLINDPVNYVRQAALIASALVLIQHTEHTSSKVSLSLWLQVAPTLKIAAIRFLVY